MLFRSIANFPLLYSAPELLLKRNQLIDQRTDIYAFSYTIYEVLFNLLPLRQSNPELLMHLMLTMKLPMISNHDSIVKVLQKASAKSIFKLPPAKLSGEEIDQILITGMDSRYQNIDAFLSDMQDLITVNQSRWIRLLQLFNR